jgi:hypothetical protein
MTGAVDRLLNIVLHDITATSAPEPTVEHHHGIDDDERFESVMLWSPDGTGASAYVDHAGPPGEALARLADQVQEWVIEELSRTLGPTNWPRCPAHPDTHPMGAVTKGGIGVWACPVDGGPTCAIGSLQTMA